MSRSGYTEDYGDDDPLALGRWRGAVNSAIRGKRGQQALREILAAIDAMQDKALAANWLVTEDGEFCTLGVLGARRGIALEKLDPEDAEGVANALGIAPAMVREIAYQNDELPDDWAWVQVEGSPTELYGERPNNFVRTKDAAGRRWQYMRKWVVAHLKTPIETGEQR